MPTFLVLAKRDGRDRTLVCEDQRAVAGDPGFDVVEFSVEAPTRGFARRAWDANRTGREIEYSGLEDDGDWGLEPLPDRELEAVVALVEALATHDQPVLEAAGAYEVGDPYLWTRDYGRWGQVDLMVPPGDPRHWGGGAQRTDRGRSAIVDIWTTQEGPWDLSLECELVSEGSRARFENLHVM